MDSAMQQVREVQINFDLLNTVNTHAWHAAGRVGSRAVRGRSRSRALSLSPSLPPSTTLPLYSAARVRSRSRARSLSLYHSLPPSLPPSLPLTLSLRRSPRPGSQFKTAGILDPALLNFPFQQVGISTSSDTTPVPPRSLDTRTRSPKAPAAAAGQASWLQPCESSFSRRKRKPECPSTSHASR